MSVQIVSGRPTRRYVDIYRYKQGWRILDRLTGESEPLPPWFGTSMEGAEVRECEWRNWCARRITEECIG